jgi:hypothetical protein
MVNKLICWVLGRHEAANNQFEEPGEETYCLRCGVTLIATIYLGQPMIIVKPKFLK